MDAARSLKNLKGAANRKKRSLKGEKGSEGSRKEVEALFDLIPDPAVILDSKGRILSVNDAVTRKTGFSRDELLGKNFLRTKIITTKSKAITISNLAKRMMGTPIPPYELEIQTKDGEKGWGEVNATRISYEGKPANLIIFRDITERKKAEEALRKSKAEYEHVSSFFSNILENMSDYVMVTDENYTLKFLNEAAKKRYGNIIGQKCYKAIRNYSSPCYHSGLPCEVHEILAKGRDYFEDTRLAEVTGRITQIRARPTTTPDGTRGIIIVSRDITEEKHAEEKRQESEKKYQTLFEDSRDAIGITTYEGKFIDANQACADLLGYTKEELLKLNIIDTYANPVDREKFQQEIERNGSVKDYEMKRLRKDGKEIDCLITSTLLHGEDSSILGYQTIIRDITERQKMEEELWEEQEKLKEAQRLGRIGNWEYDVASQRIAWSDEVFVLYERDPALGPPTAEEEAKYYSADQARTLRDYTARAIKNGEEFTYDLEANLPSGREAFFTASMRPIKDESGRVIKLFGTAQDITKRKRMEDELRRYSQQLQKLVEERTQALRASEEKYRLLIDNMAEVVFTIDLDGNFAFVSPQVESMTGYSMGQLLSMNMRQLIAPEYLPEIEKRLRARIQGEKDLPMYEFEVIRADGERIPVEMQTTLVHDEKGTLIAVQGVARDITERKKIEQIKDRFISAVTHELRTPLVSISGYTDLVLSDKSGPLNKEIRNDLEVIKRNTDRLISITDDLLDIRRIESGKLKLNMSSLNLKEIIDHCSIEIKPFLKEKQELHIQVPDVLPPIQGDQVRLSQVLLNLLSNAAKFTPEGGNIKLSVKDEEGMVKIQVSDTGIGIRNEDLKRVFEPFADIQKPTYIKGTGLGLSVAKGLVNAHGGQIYATSDGEGKGATFTFTLPKHGAKEVSQP